MRRCSVLLLLAACGGDGLPHATVDVADGMDWSLPAGVEPSANSGFYGREAAPDFSIDTHVIDVSWRQLEPTPDAFDTTATGTAQGIALASLDDQLAVPGDFWLRVWATGVDWAPAWVAADCGVQPISGVDELGQQHLPIWNPCVWGHLRDFWETLLVDRGFAADPRMRFAYVPGGFASCTFDFDMMVHASNDDGLFFSTFDAWFQQAMQDLADLAGEHAGKLLYTGEDFPAGPDGWNVDWLALDAVEKGMGIRSARTELFNFRVNHVPAWGSILDDGGYARTQDRELPPNAATEHECFTSCGYDTDDPAYAVTMANLKALQLRANWIYVAPEDSYMAELADHWDWVRLELGKTIGDAPDAWVALREAEDTYWLDTWPTTRNLERWLMQRDYEGYGIGPDGLTAPGTDVRVGVLAAENGRSTEGRRTQLATGNDHILFYLEETWVELGLHSYDVKVTFIDTDTTGWWLEYRTAAGATTSEHVRGRGDGALRTATFHLEDAILLSFDIVDGGGEDLEVRFVRVIKAL